MKAINAVVFIQNWGDNTGLINTLKHDPHIISLFHIMGGRSYLMDAGFDGKAQIEQWIGRLKSLSLPTGMPAIISIETQKVIEVFKTKSDFNLNDYLKISDNYHFFMKIDNPHHDEMLITLLRDESIVFSVLHVQGGCSFIAEVITSDYAKYKELLKKIKKLQSIHHLETLEVISVLKYRNKIIDDSGNLITPEVDIRELFSL